jgi:glutamate synthase domain-containing protein 3
MRNVSGGIAYVYDPMRRFAELCNPGMIDLERVESEDDERELRGLIEAHYRLTRSERAEEVLEKWATVLPNFVKVFPKEYKRALLGIEFGKAEY